MAACNLEDQKWLLSVCSPWPWAEPLQILQVEFISVQYDLRSRFRTDNATEQLYKNSVVRLHLDAYWEKSELKQMSEFK